MFNNLFVNFFVFVLFFLSNIHVLILCRQRGGGRTKCISIGAFPVSTIIFIMAEVLKLTHVLDFTAFVTKLRAQVLGGFSPLAYN